MEQIVVIAVKSHKGQPIDFSQLAQPPLEQAPKAEGITRGETLDRSLETPLGNLLKRRMFGEGRSRGASTEEMEDYRMFMISMNVRPQKGSAKQ